jgi:hypothetical protein
MMLNTLAANGFFLREVLQLLNQENKHTMAGANRVAISKFKCLYGNRSGCLPIYGVIVAFAFMF